ncbi:DUF447 domain-containing protein [Tundrisphaera sp. TA3]|uniref:DUF447 domain-containing protein n=1 Tax=Tundrisphaera sp. TA3 TaxID=3435775 RepID=UPI003EC00DA2
MILEGIVTTLAEDGTLNVAPMGPEVEPGDLRRFTLKPFRTSTTYRNLKATGEGVLHVSDDVLLIARAAIGTVADAPTLPTRVVRGRILASAARYHEFRVVELDDHNDRTRIVVETVAEGRLRDLFGLNRGKHAVVEAAILATRLAFLPRESVLDDFRRLAVLVDKTGGPAEREAFALLEAHARAHPGPDGGARP